MTQNQITSEDFKSGVSTIFDRWEAERVLPYAADYDNAYKNVKKVIHNEMEETRQQQEFLIFLVSVAGSKICPWAPVAVELLQKAHKWAAIKRNPDISAIKISGKTSERVIRQFVFSRHINWLASHSHKITEVLSHSYSNLSVKNDVEEMNAENYQRILRQTLIRMKIWLTALADDVRDLDDSETQNHIFKVLYNHAPYFTMAPNKKFDHDEAYGTGVPHDYLPPNDVRQKIIEKTILAGYIVGLPDAPFGNPGDKVVDRLGQLGAAVRIKSHSHNKPWVVDRGRDTVRVTQAPRARRVDKVVGDYISPADAKILYDWAAHHLKTDAARQIWLGFS